MSLRTEISAVRGRTPSRNTRSRVAQRGVAMTEAVILLPFFILIFSALMYVHQVYLAKHRARLQARTCAWTYSAGACDVANPCGASAQPRQTRSDIDSSEIESQADGARESGNGDAAGMLESVQGRLDGGLSSLLGDGVTVSAQAEVQLPFFLGGGRQVVSEEYHLACNIKKKSFTDVLGDILNPLGW